MMDGQLLALVGVFLGGALPWLEAIIVIPIGIAAGPPPVAVATPDIVRDALRGVAAAGHRVTGQGRPPPEAALELGDAW